MRSLQFRRVIRGVALVLLAWVALDLGFPSLCLLDNERADSYASAPALSAASTGERGTPSRPAHIDDCFCCSHCVDIATTPVPEGLAFIVDAPSLLPDSVPLSLQYPPYHPPRS